MPSTTEATATSLPEVIFEASRSGATTAMISVFIDGQLEVSENVNLAKPEARTEFVARLAKDHPTIDRAAAEKQLLIRGAMLGKRAARGKQVTQAAQLVEIADEADLFHDVDGEAYARFPVGNDGDVHLEVCRVRSKAFRRWLSHRHYMATSGKVPSSQALQEALEVIDGKAIFDGETREVHVRLAELNGKIYLDLCDEHWRVTEIDSTSWRIIPDSPVMFRRVKAMHQLPTPAANGDVQLLRRFVNISDEEWPLVLAWLVAGLRPTGPYPILAVMGEQGSAKTTLCRLLRMIIDPNKANLRADCREPRDLMIWATNGWVIGLDNVSYVPIWQSDCHCRLSTGGGFSTRTLYENDEETIFDASRPQLLNCIAETLTRSDILDRVISLNLPRIEEADRVSEKQLNRGFTAALPAILGGLLNAASVALRHVDSIKLDCLPRMADFATWATAAEPGLGLGPGEFLNAYTINRAGANQTAIEATPVGKVLIDFIKLKRYWSGSATELLGALEINASEKVMRFQAWPKTANTLGGIVKRLAPNLRAAGFTVAFCRAGKDGTRTITFTAPMPKPAEMSEMSSCALSASSVLPNESVGKTLQRTITNGIRIRSRPACTVY